MAEEKKQENTGIVEYESNGEIVKISPTTVRKYLVSGGGNVSDQEVMMFMSLCRYQHLNPFLKEAYLIKFGNNDPATIVTGKDVFTKRADANPNYAGKKAGIIVQKKDGSVEEREGSFVLKDESIVGGWAKVFIKGRETPEYQSVSFDEYVGRKKDGTINSQWSKKPATMIRKVAVVQALREAFPDKFQGLYAQEEFPDVSDVKLDVEKVAAEEIQANANSVDFPDATFEEVTTDSTEQTIANAETLIVSPFVVRTEITVSFLICILRISFLYLITKYLGRNFRSKKSKNETHARELRNNRIKRIFCHCFCNYIAHFISRNLNFFIYIIIIIRHLHFPHFQLFVITSAEHNQLAVNLRYSP
jgi:phage recombination protein Bet